MKPLDKFPPSQGFLYIASPYTGTPEQMEERYRAVIEFCAEQFRLGLVVYSPIAHWHPIAMLHDLPKDFLAWQKQDRAMIAASSAVAVLMLDGVDRSKGVADEITFAQALVKPIYYVYPNPVEIDEKAHP